MSLHRLATGLCLCLLVFALPVHADEPRGEPAAEVQEGGIFSLVPADAITEHKLPTETGPLPYRATAGTLDLYGQDGKVTAKVFYTAYVASERDPGRPITFAFNGGPAAPSFPGSIPVGAPCRRGQPSCLQWNWFGPTTQSVTPPRPRSVAACCTATKP